MDTHPIPQNVTSFQFKLVGEMTLKQFMYLAIGVVIAYINFVFLASRVPFIAWPMIIVSATLGVAFAFLPIADRPLDHWLAAFLKAVYTPTKRTWGKNGHLYTQDPTFINRLSLFYHPIQPLPVSQNVGATTLPITQPLAPGFIAPPPIPTPQVQTQNTVPLDLPTKEELSKTVELARQAQSIQVQIIETQKRLTGFKDNTPNSQEASVQINTILSNLQTLVTDASQVKQKLDALTHTPQTVKSTVKVSAVAPVKPKPTQIVLTTTPNVISGFIKDAVGNYLDSVVVVIYDKQGLPVRALKTNKLGQFSGATPLPNGVYTLQLEKDNLSFDVLEIELTGDVLPAIDVAAKKSI